MTVRRSVALPRGLVEEVNAVAPRELRENFNRLVITALGEFARGRRAAKFREEMARMAADHQVIADCAATYRAFAQTDGDGLGELP
jgi:hypothetical protein